MIINMIDFEIFLLYNLAKLCVDAIVKGEDEADYEM